MLGNPTMLRTIDLFRNTLPLSWRDIKVEVHSKVAMYPITRGCRREDAAFPKAFVLGFWPFIDTFPAIIQSTRATCNRLRA